MNTILILLLIHYFGFFITKSNNNKVLSCGLFAWAGKDIKDFNQSKFNMLGVLNEPRGKHSCGVSTDGEIYNGIDTNKVFRDFISSGGYPKPTKIPTVIGHTRHSTMGVHNLENAHPFGFGIANKDNAFAFIGAHNGTLLNHESFAKNYDVNLTKEVVDNNKKIKTVNKIDSEILLESIYNSGNYKVLSEYNGAAALLFTNINEPNIIYAYHGASKKYNHSDNKDIFIERPLFYYKESRTSLYISSLKDSLFSIGATDKTIGEFDCNIVYKIKNGNISVCKKFEISRFKNYNTYSSYTGYNNKPINKPKKYLSSRHDYRRNNVITLQPGQQNKMNFSKEDNSFNLFNELVNKDNINAYGSSIYFNKLRYWRTGHLVTGVFVYIENYGFHYLGEKIKDSLSSFNKLLGVSFSIKKGNFLTNLKSSDKSDLFIPFPVNKYTGLNNDQFLHFMYDGINIKRGLDYQMCIQYKGTTDEFSWEQLSCCSKHPIIDIKRQCVRSDQQNIMLHYDLYNGIFSPLGSERNYEIENGNCILYEEVNPIYTEIKNKKNIKNLNELSTELIKAEQEQTLKENYDLLDKTIEEIFNNPFKSFPLALKRLQQFKKEPKGKEAINILQKFLLGTSKLIAIEQIDN